MLVTLALALSCAPLPGRAQAPEESGIDSLLQAAQAFAAGDDHARAIAAYEAILDADPERRDAVLVPLAAQRTWSGQLDTACADLSGYLDRHPDDDEARLLYALALSWNDETRPALEEYRRVLERTPGQRDAALGEARMLSWLGDSDAALARYQELTAGDPAWIEPQLGAAQVLGWRGDHRRAAARYRAVLDRFPDHAGAAEGLAQNLRWDGHADLASDVLADLENAGHATQSSRTLARELDLAARPRTALAYDVAEDSDDFLAQSWRWELEASPLRRGTVRAAFARHRFERTPDPTAHETWLETAARHRLTTEIEMSAAFAIALERSRSSAERPWTAELRGHLLPGDRTRFELGYARLSFFSYRTFPDRIDADLLGGAAIWRVRPGTTVALHADWATFEDDNERRNLRATGHWIARPRGPRLELGGGFHWLDHDHDRDNGIWTPEEYRALFLKGTVSYDHAQLGSIGAELDGGWARDRSSPDLTPYLSAALFGYRAIQQFELRIRAGRSDSNVESGRGYRRDFASASLGFHFQ